MFISFSLIPACIQPIGPEVETVEDIYILSILQAGTGRQLVAVHHSVVDPGPVQDFYAPNDPPTFLENAIVRLSSDEWEIRLQKDSYSPEYQRPFFSTAHSPIAILPQEPYTLSVEWNNTTIRAETTVPAPPVLDKPDTTVIIQQNILKISWSSSLKNLFVSYRFPLHVDDVPFTGNEYLSSRFVTGSEAELSILEQVDAEGEVTVILYHFNEDFARYAKSLETGDEKSRHHSNIAGAHGLFAAMASDTMRFRYRKAD